MSQTKLTISIPNDEQQLVNDITRVSTLTYTPQATMCRKLMRIGLQHLPQSEKLKTGLITIV